MKTQDTQPRREEDYSRIVAADETVRHGPLWRFIDSTLEKRENRVKRPVNRKTYLRLCWLGAFGVHRFYAKQWITACLYLATCWTGFSVAMTMVDVIIALPMKPDENGMIYL